MKNSKKTSGVLGTSIGSMLIIVALLTMVGIGSQDTYAGTSLTGETCDCPKDTTRSGDNCIKKVTTVVDTKDCKCGFGSRPNGDQCVVTTPEGATEFAGNCTCGSSEYTQNGSKCIKSITSTSTTKCTCTGGGTPNSSGKCEEKEPSTKNCLSTQYKSGNNCLPCPDNAKCDGISFSCLSEEYEKTGSGCTPKDPNNPPKDPTDYGKSECKTVNEPCEIHGRTGICTLTGGKKLCQITTSPSGGNDDDNGSTCSKANEPCKLNGKNGTCQASGDGFTCKVPNTPTGGDDKPNNPNKPTGGDDKPSNPNTPTGGDDGSGGNGGGNSGGNGNGGNTGGNNGNNNGGNNATKNPNTATKAPLVIAIIGIISVGISSVVYFKGKKEINTEI